MKATVSKDGLMRFTMSVTHRFGLETLVHAALYDNEDESPKSRTAWLAVVRNALNYAGSDIWARVEQVCESRVDEVRDEALELFPELAPKVAKEESVVAAIKQWPQAGNQGRGPQ